MKRCIFFFLFYICVLIVRGALNLNFEVLDITSGLPTNAILRIHQDREGYMWFASPNGLICYDGYEYKEFKNTSEDPDLLCSNDVKSIADTKNSVWIGTENGLNKYTKRSRTFERVDLGDLNVSVILKILVENDSSLWLGTSQGIVHYNPFGDGYTIYRSGKTADGNPLPFKGVQDVCLDSKGRIWFALWEGGVIRYNQRMDTFIAYPPVNKNNSAVTLFEDHTGTIWIGSWGHGLFKMNECENVSETTYTCYTESPAGNSIGSNYIYSLIQDIHTGMLWIGHRKGLSLLKNPTGESAEFENYYSSRPASSVYDLVDLNAMCIDRTGIIWLGLLNSGIRKVHFNTNFLEQNSLFPIHKQVGTSYITAMSMVKPDVLWLGIKNNGVWIHDMKANTYCPVSDYMGKTEFSNDSYILDIKKVEHLQEIWVTVRNKGVYRIKTNMNGYPRSYASLQMIGEFGLKALKVHEDRHDNIWLLSSIGVAVCPNGGDWMICDSFIPGKNEKCVAQCIAEDREGNMWIGTRNHGIFKFILDNGKQLNITPYTIENEKLNIRTIMAMMVDSQRRVWAATHGGGVSVYSPDENLFKSVNQRYNISQDVIYNMFEDNEHCIWMNSEKSLVRLDMNDQTVQELNVADKLWNNMFVPSCPIVQISDSRYLLAGFHGYNVLDVSKPFSRSSTHPPVITDIFLSGKSVYDTYKEQLGSEEIPLQLPHYENDFVFTFSSMVYDNPGKHRYAYRLSGYDERWNITLSGQHVVSYTNIPPGNYVFQLKAITDTGIETSEESSWNFIIQPSVFNTWYAWCIYVLLFVLVMIVSLRIVYGRVRLKQKLRQAEEQQKNAEELAQTKLRFFTNISHDLLTPLAVLECAVDNIRTEGASPVILQTMTNNVAYLTRLLRQILEFRKMEHDKLQLKIQYGNISETIRNICNVDVLPLMRKKQITLRVVLPANDVMGWFDSDKLDKIVYNLLSNAYKYNKTGGSISVEVAIQENSLGRMLSLKVADTGIGIAQENLPHIFNRFYDGEYRKQNVTGTGIGLSLVKSLIDLHGGTIEVDSTLGEGTIFKIELPIEFEAFEKKRVEILSNETNDSTTIKTENTFDADKIHGQGHAVLLVEDNTDLLKGISCLLSKYYRVVTAENGKDALDVLYREDVDMVVSDVMMPEMDGFELCKAIKSDIAISHLPVILLTAKVMEEDRMAGYDVGAIGYITKPFAPALLLMRISSVFQNREMLMEHYMKQESVQFEVDGYSSLDEEFLRRTNQLVIDNIDNSEFDLAGFAEEMGMSKSTLYRKLKEITGVTPIEFIKNVRLNYSRRLLREKVVNVSDVAYAVGFTDPKYFSKCFKKEYGMTPNEYSKKEGGSSDK